MEHPTLKKESPNLPLHYAYLLNTNKFFKKRKDFTMRSSSSL